MNRDDKEFARQTFINSISLALKRFDYEDVDDVFSKVMGIYYKKYASFAQDIKEANNEH